jgi:transposase-like protein
VLSGKLGHLGPFEEEGTMPGKRYGAEQIIPKLREADVDLAKGLTVAQACKKIGVTEQTYYRWRKDYGGIRIDQAKRMKDLKKENARLKRPLADAELDKAILREAASVLGTKIVRQKTYENPGRAKHHKVTAERRAIRARQGISP